MRDLDKPEVTLIVPVHNEVTCAADAIREADAVLSSAARCHEIVVVDDGSTDGTTGLLESLACSMTSLETIRLPSRRGKGHALRVGFARAQYETVSFIDADVEVPASALESLLQRCRDDVLVVGYRVGRRLSLSRRLLSLGYRLTARVLLGVSARDIGCPMKVFPRALVSDARLISDGWVIDAELLALAAQSGYRTEEVPVPSRFREGRTSHVRAIPAALSGLVGIARLLVHWTLRPKR